MCLTGFIRYYWTCHVGKSAEEEVGCDWFEWAEINEAGDNIHPLRNKKKRDTQENDQQQKDSTIL